MTIQQAVKLFAPAKINLLLAVLGLREDGYHELATVMHQISLADVVHLQLSDEPGIRIHTTNPLLNDDESNLAYQAANCYLQLIKSNQGVNILIEKMIPLGAGLAGGSSDAAAVLLGLNQLHNEYLQATQLNELAAKLGSDVPFCLTGGTALARGRGELLTPLLVNGSPYFLLVKPAISVNTATIYQGWDRQSNDFCPPLEDIIRCLQDGDWESLAPQMYNGLEAITTAMVPQVREITQRMLHRGAKGALMSGSGPTVFGIFSTAAAAENAYKVFRDEYNECYLVTSFQNQVNGYNNGGETEWKED